MINKKLYNWIKKMDEPSNSSNNQEDINQNNEEYNENDYNNENESHQN